MSGIFDLPSVRFLQRFRFLELRLQTFAASLFRSLSVPVCALRQVHSRHDEAEFPSASQSAWNEFDSALDESRATDGVPSFFGALRPFDNWKTVKDQHELSEDEVGWVEWHCRDLMPEFGYQPRLSRRELRYFVRPIRGERAREYLKSRAYSLRDDWIRGPVGRV